MCPTPLPLPPPPTNQRVDPMKWSQPGEEGWWDDGFVYLSPGAGYSINHYGSLAWGMWLVGVGWGGGGTMKG